MSTRTRNAWTSAELTQLRKKFPVLTPAELRKAFPRHTLGSIRATAYDMQLVRERHGHRYWRKIAANWVPTFTFGHHQRIHRAMEAAE